MERIDRVLVLLATASALAMSSPALGHGGHRTDKGAAAQAATAAPEQKPWGIAGDPNAATRTIAMDMSDEMRYHPASITVKRGDTVRFELRNSGKAMHEMVIGTKRELDKHSDLMKEFPDMEHEEPWMAHVAPGETATIVWHFNRPGVFYYACLLPGHYEAGMVGKVEVK